MSECGPDCNCEDAQRRRTNGVATPYRKHDSDFSIREVGPSADEMNAGVRGFPAGAKTFTITAGPFKGRVYRVNGAGQKVRQKHLERTAKL